jgi:predicted transcriptional regulator
MNNDLHEVQASILKELLFHNGTNFASLNKHGLTNDHFTFHIQRLLKEEIIEKKGKLYYLTQKGKQFAGKLDIDALKMEKFATPGVAVTAKKLIKGVPHYLIQQRLKEPFYGYYGFINGKIRFGEYSEDTAKIMITVGNPTAEGNATLTANPTTSFAGDPVTFTVSFKNTGNTSTVPKGRILILDEQQTPTLVLPINPTGKAITSHNSTSFNVTTSEIYSIGKEQVRLELWYGNGSQKQYTSQTMSLYRLPKRNIVYIGGGIVLGVPLLGAWHRKRKRNKKISSV